MPALLLRLAFSPQPPPPTSSMDPAGTTSSTGAKEIVKFPFLRSAVILQSTSSTLPSSMASLRPSANIQPLTWRMPVGRSGTRIQTLLNPVSFSKLALEWRMPSLLAKLLTRRFCSVSEERQANTTSHLKKLLSGPPSFSLEPLALLQTHGQASLVRLVMLSSMASISISRPLQLL